MDISLNRLHYLADEAAISGDYQKAIEINEQIVKKSAGDVDAMLRLGFAFMMTGQYSQSKKIYRKILKLEPINQIARNNLDKIVILEKKESPDSTVTGDNVVRDPNLFLNVIGKTREVSLVNIGQADILADLEIGETIILKVKKRRVEVRNQNNGYIGALPDDISRRLIYFLESGSEYSGFIKSASKNNVDIFLREEKKGRKVKNFVSFPKNIQDDLKSMGGEEETEEKDEDGEVPEERELAEVDLDKLAEEAENAELYGHEKTDTYEEEEEE